MALRNLEIGHFSSLTPKGSELAMEALEAGAVDVMAKPGGPLSVGEATVQLAERVRAASKVRFFRRGDSSASKAKGTVAFKTTQKIVALGASTGGTEALRVVLEGCPRALRGW